MRMDHWSAGLKGGHAYPRTGKGDSRWLIDDPELQDDDKEAKKLRSEGLP